VLIKGRRVTSAAAMASVMSLAAPVGTATNVRWIGELALLKVANTAPVAAVSNRLSLEPEVECAQPNYFLPLRVRSGPIARAPA
jgi:hypothetical protein